jgi:hypothetical protein
MVVYGLPEGWSVRILNVVSAWFVMKFGLAFLVVYGRPGIDPQATEFGFLAK